VTAGIVAEESSIRRRGNGAESRVWGRPSFCAAETLMKDEQAPQSSSAVILTGQEDSGVIKIGMVRSCATGTVSERFRSMAGSEDGRMGRGLEGKGLVRHGWER
jgi:hypothetical protein